MKFEPAMLVVNNGDRVTWINKDIVDHDVTEKKSKAWKSSTLKAGQKFTRIIKASADYFCSIHVVMKGKLKVK